MGFVMKSNCRLVLVTNIYAPYREPVWEKLADRVTSLDVILIRETESCRLWQRDIKKKRPSYSLHVLGSKGGYFGQLDSGFYIGGGIRNLLHKITPTNLIIAGYSAGPFIEAMFWAKQKKVPFVQWYESHYLSSHFKWGPVAWLRKLLLRWSDACVVPGVMSKAYLEVMGIPADKIVIAPNTVNVQKIFFLIKKYFQNTPPTGKARILFIGQYIYRKRIDLLIEAYKTFDPDLAILRILGHGPLEDHLHKIAGKHPGIKFLPATHNLEETVHHYMWADIVVMPSDREVWGLVINEALAAGCYVISSSLAGVTPDLVENAPLDVGKTVNPFNGVLSLANILSETVDSIESIRLKRQSIAEWGQKFSPESTVDGLLSAIALSDHKKYNSSNQNIDS